MGGKRQKNGLGAERAMPAQTAFAGAGEGRLRAMRSMWKRKR